MKARFPAYTCFLLIVLFGGTSASLTSQQQATSEASASAVQQRALINQYCVACHNQRLKTAGLALDEIDLNNVSDNAEIWEKVVSKLRARYMPPVGRPRPSDEQYEGLIAHMET